MKYAFCFLLPFIFSACSETSPTLEIRTLSGIKGKRTEIPDSSVLEMVSFSGYDVKHADVSPQIIARYPKDDKLYRIIVLPLFADYPVKKHMTFRLADKLNLQALKQISEAKLPASHMLNEAMQDGFVKIKKEARTSCIVNYIEGDEMKIKVFFNPAHRDTEEQELPVLMGWVQ